MVVWQSTPYVHQVHQHSTIRWSKEKNGYNGEALKNFSQFLIVLSKKTIET